MFLFFFVEYKAVLQLQFGFSALNTASINAVAKRTESAMGAAGFYWLGLSKRRVCYTMPTRSTPWLKPKHVVAQRRAQYKEHFQRLVVVKILLFCAGGLVASSGGVSGALLLRRPCVADPQRCSLAAWTAHTGLGGQTR